MIKRSFTPIVDADTRLLVLGSLPGDRSLAAAQYYAHPQNQFWRLISVVIDRDIATLRYDARLAALRDTQVGLWDVVESAVRPGSTDAAIRDMVGNDLSALIATLPNLRAIAFNGATAHRHGAKQIGATHLPLIALPSSSPLHTIGLAEKLPAWRGLSQYLTGASA